MFAVSRLVFARSLDDDDALNFDSSHLDVVCIVSILTKQLQYPISRAVILM